MTSGSPSDRPSHRRGVLRGVGTRDSGYDPSGMTSLIYNALLFAADALLLWAAARRRSANIAFLGTATLGMGALILAAGMGEALFEVLRLLAYAIFLHGIVLLTGLGVVFRARKAGVLLFVVAALLGVIAIDAFLIEPRWLEVSRITLPSPKIKRPIRVALIADFQTDHIGDYERDVLARVMAEHPDLILLAGDHLQAEPRALGPLRLEFRTLLRQLSAPLGIYAVRGNMDDSDWARSFEGLPIRTLEQTQSFDLGDLRLTGLSMKDSFTATLSVPPSDQFLLVMGHSPDFSLGQVQGDLLVAGHTHGGQVRLPGLGPVMTESHIPRAWAAGVTALPGGRTLVVSRGIGMERETAPRLRFLCRPELVLIDLVPAP